MLESEYYDLIYELEKLEFRIPQSGIKFKYNDFIVESLTDFTGKLVYTIKRDAYILIVDYAHLYPHENSNIGFSIRDMNMKYEHMMDFIHTVKNKNNQEEKKISIYKGYYIQLLKNSKDISCPICLDDYTDDSIYIYKCGHHCHTNCFIIYGIDICPICRT